MQHLRQMRGLDVYTPRQISNRAREFQDAMIGTCRQIELTHLHPHQTLAFILQLIKLANFRHAQIGVAYDTGALGIGIRKAGSLNVPCRFRPLTN